MTLGHTATEKLVTVEYGVVLPTQGAPQRPTLARCYLVPGLDGGGRGVGRSGFRTDKELRGKRLLDVATLGSIFRNKHMSYLLFVFFIWTVVVVFFIILFHWGVPIVSTGRHFKHGLSFLHCRSVHLGCFNSWPFSWPLSLLQNLKMTFQKHWETSEIGPSALGPAGVLKHGPVKLRKDI